MPAHDLAAVTTTCKAGIRQILHLPNHAPPNTDKPTAMADQTNTRRCDKLPASCTPRRCHEVTLNAVAQTHRHMAPCMIL
jgi:hypothetical protein